MRLAVVRTIIKAQGWAMQRVGVRLPKPAGSHGQLCLAVCRVGTSDRARVAVVPESSQPDDGMCTSNGAHPVMLGWDGLWQCPE